MRDYLLKGSSRTLRFALVQCTSAAETARLRWQVSDPSAVSLFSRALASASLLASFLKGEERVQLHWLCSDSAAPVSEVYAEALPIGEVRGFIRGTALGGCRIGAWDGRMPTAAGGTFSVSRVLYGAHHQQRSVVALAEGDISSEILQYYAQSEQRAAAVRLDAVVGAAGSVAWCSGMLCEAIPGEGGRQAPPQPASALEAGAGASFETLAQALRAEESPWPCGVDAHTAASTLAPTLTWARRVPVDFFCRCSAAGFIEKMVGSCSKDLLQQMMAEAVEGVAATLVCHFCNKSYAIGTLDLHERLSKTM